MQGNGLGLTKYAKNLAQQLGGDVTLVSDPYVKIVFTVKLKKLPINHFGRKKFVRFIQEF